MTELPFLTQNRHFRLHPCRFSVVSETGHWREAAWRLATRGHRLPIPARFRHFRLHPCLPTVVPRSPFEAAVVRQLATAGPAGSQQYPSVIAVRGLGTSLPTHGGTDRPTRGPPGSVSTESGCRGVSTSSSGVTFGRLKYGYFVSV